jgi:hypothetical protein
MELTQARAASQSRIGKPLSFERCESKSKEFAPGASISVGGVTSAGTVATSVLRGLPGSSDLRSLSMEQR